MKLRRLLGKRGISIPKLLVVLRLNYLRKWLVTRRVALTMSQRLWLLVTPWFSLVRSRPLCFVSLASSVRWSRRLSLASGNLGSGLRNGHPDKLKPFSTCLSNVMLILGLINRRNALHPLRVLCLACLIMINIFGTTPSELVSCLQWLRCFPRLVQNVRVLVKDARVANIILVALVVSLCFDLEELVRITIGRFRGECVMPSGFPI